MPVLATGIPTTMTSNSPRPAARHAFRPLPALLLLGLLALLGACASNRDQLDLARGGAAVVYERARTALDNQDYENAIRLYEALVARYPFVPEARQARLDLIYAYYKGRESESALDQADTFIRENPTHPRIDYAWYVKGLVDFERSANLLERWLDVDLDARPPQTARRSFNSFRKVVEEFPKSEYAHDARRRMIHLRNRLADYEIYVARYYIEREAWVGAARRARETIEQYDGSPAVREALEILILCYDRLEMKELAAQTREVYAANYGGTAEKVVPTKKPWWRIWG
jgi:outer membrane protein assembly factor BamD